MYSFRHDVDVFAKYLLEWEHCQTFQLNSHVCDWQNLHVYWICVSTIVPEYMVLNLCSVVVFKAFCDEGKVVFILLFLLLVCAILWRLERQDLVHIILFVAFSLLSPAAFEVVEPDIAVTLTTALMLEPLAEVCGPSFYVLLAAWKLTSSASRTSYLADDLQASARAVWNGP